VREKIGGPPPLMVDLLEKCLELPEIARKLILFWPPPRHVRWKFWLVSMGGWTEGEACADPGARTPIGASGNFCVHLYITEIKESHPSVGVTGPDRHEQNGGALLRGGKLSNLFEYFKILWYAYAITFSHATHVFDDEVWILSLSIPGVKYQDWWSTKRSGRKIMGIGLRRRKMPWSKLFIYLFALSTTT
jgi:hypothetical protein